MFSKKPGARRAATSVPDDGAGLTSAEVERWWRGAGQQLADARVHGSVGRGIVAEGSGAVVWISVTSAWATGRLVRAGDGASQLDVHRLSDGATLLQERHPTTTTAQLNDLLRACAEPEHPNPAPPAFG